MDIGVIGTSIWQQNISLLERLTIDKESRPRISGILKLKLDVGELIYLATCNRVEFIYANSEKYSGARLLHQIIDFFFKGKKDLNFFPNDFFHYTGKEAITHIFRTASSLESMVMGENQITGQFKDAYQEARDNNIIGPVLNRLAGEALAVTRKVKGQTSLARGSLSVASLASAELNKALTTPDPKVAIVGSGPMQIKMASYLRSKLKASLVCVSRTAEKANAMAGKFGGIGITLDNFKKDPGKIDAIISATAATEPVFGADFLNKLSQNKKKVICLDMAIPRDFSFDFIDDDRIVLIDIPTLKTRGQGNLRQKFVEAGKANEIIREAVNQYMSDQIEVSLRPIFRDCHKESVEMAEKSMNDLFTGQLAELPQNDKEAVRRLIGRVIGQTAFGPLKKISNNIFKNGSKIGLEELKLRQTGK